MKVHQRVARDSLAEKEIFKLAAVTENINIVVPMYFIFNTLFKDGFNS